jgi:hypothetical protein
MSMTGWNVIPNDMLMGPMRSNSLQSETRVSTRPFFVIWAHVLTRSSSFMFASMIQNLPAANSRLGFAKMV